jgi:hypothetical protein
MDNGWPGLLGWSLLVVDVPIIQDKRSVDTNQGKPGANSLFPFSGREEGER